MADGRATEMGAKVLPIDTTAAEEAARAEARVEEAKQDTAVVWAVIDATAKATTLLDGARAALEAILASYGWMYGAYWELNTEAQKLEYVADGGFVNDDFSRMTRALSFPIGKGLPGQAWKDGELIFVADIADLPSFPRLKCGKAANVNSALGFPIKRNGQVVGAMDFFTTKTIEMSETRLITLRLVAALIATSLERIEFGVREAEAKAREKETFRQIEAASHKLVAGSESLADVANNLAMGSTQTALQSANVSNVAEQIKTSVNSVAAAAEELSATVREIAVNASESAKTARSARDIATAAEKTVQALSASSVAIGRVTKVISTIAQQTNLLALNATIEAARAGESGKGFAVVANEVKELAKETARATEEIAQQIETIQSDTTKSVDAIGQISKIIGQIDAFASSIAAAVEEQSATVREVARNANEVSAGVGSVVENIGDVAVAAREGEKNAALAQLSASSIHALATELEALTKR